MPQFLALRLSYAIVLLAIMIFSVILLPPGKADANGPILMVGDHWTYDYSTITSVSYLNSTATQPFKYAPAISTIAAAPPLIFNLTGVLIQTFVGAVTVASSSVATIGNRGYGDLAYGGKVVGNWTLSGTALFRLSDFASMGGTIAIKLQANASTYEVITTDFMNPALETLRFPLFNGKTWTQTVTTTANSTTISSPPIPPTKTSTSPKNTTATITYSVVNNPTITVPAGSFDTYEVLSSDGSTVDLSFYSPGTSLVVRHVISFVNGPVITTMSLRDYTLPYQTTYGFPGTGLSVSIQSEAAISDFRQNGTAFSFTVSVSQGTTARVVILVPKQLNSSDLSVYLDNRSIFPAITDPERNNTLTLAVPESTHTVTVIYAKPSPTASPPTGSQPSVPATYALGAISFLVIIIATLLFKRRRSQIVGSSSKVH